MALIVLFSRTHLVLTSPQRGEGRAHPNREAQANPYCTQLATREMGNEPTLGTVWSELGGLLLRCGCRNDDFLTM